MAKHVLDTAARDANLDSNRGSSFGRTGNAYEVGFSPGGSSIKHRDMETDADAEANFFGPRKRMMDVYVETMDRLHLDGYVYRAIQMPPVDETMSQDGT